MSTSWVTRMMVRACSRLSEVNVSMISGEVRVSRLPVGSSASSRLGAPIRARRSRRAAAAAGELAGRVALALAVYFGAAGFAERRLTM
jgi:hypothetical protein